MTSQKATDFRITTTLIKTPMHFVALYSILFCRKKKKNRTTKASPRPIYSKTMVSQLASLHPFPSII